jgi:hypothetical protein
MTRRPTAFSLVEVLVALGMFAFAVVGLLIAYNSSLSAAREVRRESEIRRLLEDRMAEWEGIPLEPTENRLESSIPGVTLLETCQREELIGPEQTIYSGFWKITLTATWEDAGSPQSLQADFLRYQP